MTSFVKFIIMVNRVFDMSGVTVCNTNTCRCLHSVCHFRERRAVQNPIFTLKAAKHVFFHEISV
jgi:hypothetical protein